MSKYTRIFVRFLPNPETQEFINVGVIVGDEATGYWVAHKAKCETRINTLASHSGVNEVDTFFTWLDEYLTKSNRRNGKTVRTDLSFFTKLQIQNTGKRVQISNPEEVEGNSPESYIASLLGTVILEDAEVPKVTENVTRHPGLYKASEIGRNHDNCLDPLGRKAKSDEVKVLEYTWKAIDSVIDIFESLFETVADHYLDNLSKKNEERRMKDPIYHNIEKRRRPEGHDGSVILISEEHKLGWEEYDIQSKIGDRVDYTPWWYGLARYFRNHPISKAINPIRVNHQKKTRGWTDSDLWSLNQTFCSRLGEQLLELSHISHGYPGVGIYSDPDRWMEDLHKHGYSLLVYGNMDLGREIDEDYFSELKSKEDDPTISAQKNKFAKELSREEYAYEKAQESLRWVATYLGHLWD